MDTINRRETLAGLAALGLVGTIPGAATAAKASGRLVQVNGTRLWVDDSGPRDAPVIVYMHGGPGVGSLEFETYMKPVLAERVRLISVDQRGTLRSDPVAKDVKISAADIVDDFEKLRDILKIPQWQPVGHSFGGHLALRYALRFPERVTRLTLENPGYDVPSAFHWLAASGAQLLNGIDTDAAVEANRLAQQVTPVDDAFIGSIGKTLGALGDRRQDLYVVQEKNRDMFSRLAKESGLPDSRWEQGQVPGMALLHSADFFEPMISRVKDVKVPMLLVRGSGDHACSPDQIAALLDAGARFETVQNAGHFIHVEEPAALADLIVS